MAMQPMPSHHPFPDGTALFADAPALRALAQREGVVLLRGLIPATELTFVQQLLHAAAVEVGWISAGTSQPGVRENGNDPQWQAWYQQVQKLRAFHALPHLQSIQHAMQAIVGGEVLTHPRHIARCVGPQTAPFTTPPHQDVWYIGGTTEVWTLWAPLTDCPEELGGLAVVPRSHSSGTLPSREASGAGGRGVSGELTGAWAWEPLQLGDALIFHSQTVHQGCDNRSERMRYSIDLRYQRADLPVREDSLRPHYTHTWDEIYRDWPEADPLKYYWRQQQLEVEMV